MSCRHCYCHLCNYVADRILGIHVDNLFVDVCVQTLQFFPQSPPPLFFNPPPPPPLKWARETFEELFVRPGTVMTQCLEWVEWSHTPIRFLLRILCCMCLSLAVICTASLHQSHTLFLSFSGSGINKDAIWCMQSCVQSVAVYLCCYWSWSSEHCPS